MNNKKIDGNLTHMEFIRTKIRKRDLIELMVSLFESSLQAGNDFVGDQRKWHLPRLDKATKMLIMLFPREAALALLKAKTPYDE